MTSPANDPPTQISSRRRGGNGPGSRNNGYARGRSPMTERWRQAVEEKRDALRRVAASDLPLADDARALLEAAEESVEVATG